MKYLKAAMLAALVVAVPRAGAVDVESFIRKDKFEQIKISPKGEYFAATVPLEKQTILAIIRRSDNKVLSKFGMGENTVVQSVHWVNPERVLFSMGEKFGALDQPASTGELYALDAKEGSTGELMVGQRVATNIGSGAGSHIQTKKVESVWAELIDDLRGDDKTVLIEVGTFGADFPHVERMDVYSGHRLRVATSPVRNAEFLTDNAGVVRFARGEEFDNSHKLYYRDGDGSDWRLINDEAKTGLDRWPVGFSADNKKAYLETEQASGPNHIIEWDAASGESHDLLADDTVDPAGILHEVGTDIPVGAMFDKGPAVSRFFDKASRRATLQANLEAAFQGQDVLVTSQTDDGSIALVLVGSDRNPGDYYLFDTRTQKANYLLSNGDWFDPDHMNPTKMIAFNARDGLPIHGLLTTPNGAEGKRLPMVVLPHGGPFGIQDTWGFDHQVQLLASAGYAVLQVNYRGSGGFGRAFHEAGRKQWGGTMQDDLTDATRWAIAQGHADGARVCLFGGSYGGYASLMGVAKEPTLYKCAVGYAGVYDLPTMYTDGDIHERANGKNYLADWVGDRNAVAAVSPTRMANRIKVPVFLAAGGEDERAPIQHSKMMEQALRQAGVPVETLYYDTEGHGFYKLEHQREFYTKLLAFLAKNIGGEVATTSTGSSATAK
ncbi:alpha/beta hydrolase family protein [Lysobacter claricitrinus]|uniref:alpha/beta hydrolase family protein n=1 Tax=Lysobacter claricitrinus TaxID=3367728 RepID=UPI0037DB927C